MPDPLEMDDLIIEAQTQNFTQKQKQDKAVEVYSRYENNLTVKRISEMYGVAMPEQHCNLWKRTQTLAGPQHHQTGQITIMQGDLLFTFHFCTSVRVASSQKKAHPPLI